ncbi:MAG: hypothetical protein ACJ8GW_17835 [Massilia sp.]
MPVLDWIRRPEALLPAGMVTTGAAMQGLLAQLRLVSEEVLAGLRIVATPDMLVLLAANEELPWVDGARYCAPDPAAQTLWLPTTMMPTMPTDLLRRSAIARLGTESVLLWHEPEHFLPLRDARNLTPRLLELLIKACP